MQRSYGQLDILLVFKLQQPRGGHSSLQGGCNVPLKACTHCVSDGCPCSSRQVFSKITVVARRICQDQCSSLVQSLDASTQNQQWRVCSTSMHQFLQTGQGLHERSQQMFFFALGCCLLETGFRYPSGATGACGKGREGQGIALSQSCDRSLPLTFCVYLFCRDLRAEL